MWFLLLFLCMLIDCMFFFSFMCSYFMSSVSTVFNKMSSFHHHFNLFNFFVVKQLFLCFQCNQLFGKFITQIQKQPCTDFKNHFRINNNWCNQLLTNQSTDSIPSTPHKFRTPPYSPPSPLTSTLSPLGILYSMSFVCL